MDFREALIKARALERLDRAISDAGYLPMSGQIVDATLVAAPKQRNTETEKADLKAGTIHPVDIAIPAFGYKSHISVDRRHKIIRRQKVTDAAAADGARLREGLIDPNNTAADVWGDSAYRSRANEAYLDKHGRTSRIHHRKPPGRPMPEAMQRANGKKSKVRSRVEHVFAEQKHRMGLFVRTIGIARAEAVITFANMAFNMKRWCWLERNPKTA